MGICQENICIVDVLKEQLNFVLSAHQRILHKCIHAVEIDFLKFNFKKTYCLVLNIRLNNLLLSKPYV